ncbi:DUF488 domain-containing protein [Pseudolysinimonas sp.]
MEDPVAVATIGHGLMPWNVFAARLLASRVNVVVDVRSQPTSQRAPHYSRQILEPALRDAGLEYLFMGRELGGRPPEAEYYDPSGHVLYRPLSRSTKFVSGLDTLIARAMVDRVALMCSESDYSACHRNLLVGRALRQRNVRVVHLLHDGTAKDFDDALVSGLELPGMEEDPWRSLVQVRPELAHRISLND